MQRALLIVCKRIAYNETVFVRLHVLVDDLINEAIK